MEIENWDDSKNKTLSEAKLLRTENQSLKEEASTAKKRIKELENQVSKLQNNLASSNIQYTKAKKEKNETMKELAKVETAHAKIEEKVDTLEVEKKNLEMQIKTHEKFIQKEFGGKEHLTRVEIETKFRGMEELLRQKDQGNEDLKQRLEKLQLDVESSEGTKIKQNSTGN